MTEENYKNVIALATKFKISESLELLGRLYSSNQVPNKSESNEIICTYCRLSNTQTVEAAIKIIYHAHSYIPEKTEFSDLGIKLCAWYIILIAASTV